MTRPTVAEVAAARLARELTGTPQPPEGCTRQAIVSLGAAAQIGGVIALAVGAWQLTGELWTANPAFAALTAGCVLIAFFSMWGSRFTARSCRDLEYLELSDTYRSEWGDR